MSDASSSSSSSSSSTTAAVVSADDTSGPMIMCGANPDMSSSVITVTFTRLGGVKREMTVDTTTKCSEFMIELASLFELDASKMKLVCSGKMLKHSSDKPLSDFKVKRGAKLILMNKPKSLATAAAAPPPKPATTIAEDSKVEDDYGTTGVRISDSLSALAKLDEIRKAAEALAQRSDDGFEWHSQHYMEITNQYGERVEMDEASRKGMTTGMVLHKKAQAYMKEPDKNYEMAAMLCELAFESFQKTVKRRWLDIIDNYGMVALDRVWLYFLMKDDSKMMDAFRWLSVAEQSLEKSHGRHLERLKAIRGGDSFLPELAMYARLDILRGMNCLMSGDAGQAELLCDRARRTLRKLTVNEMDLAELMSMDFSIKEAKRGLRACNSDKGRAVEYILRMREERAERRRQERERIEQRRRQRMYGLTKSGKFVDLKLLSALMDMGIEEELCVEVLRQVDNHYEMAMDLVLDVTKKEQVWNTLVQRAMDTVTDDMIEPLLKMGYTESRIRGAFVLRNCDYDAAMDMLTNPDPSCEAQLSRMEMRLVALVMARALIREQEAKAAAAAAAAETAASATEDASAVTDDDTLDRITAAVRASIEEDEASMMASAAGATLTSSAAGAAAASSSSSDGDVEMMDACAPDSAAFPNPEKGDSAAAATATAAADGTGDGDWTEDMEMTDKFDTVKHRRDSEKRREDALIDREILDDLEEEDGFDDAHAYLDLDLTDELAAVDQLSVMIVSMK